MGAVLRRLTEQAADLVFLDLPGRVAKLLVRFTEREDLGSDGVFVLDLSLTQTDLAEMVGGSRQGVNQILNALERRGILEVRGHEIVIKDMDALRRRGGPSWQGVSVVVRDPVMPARAARPPEPPVATSIGLVAPVTEDPDRRETIQHDLGQATVGLTLAERKVVTLPRRARRPTQRPTSPSAAPSGGRSFQPEMSTKRPRRPRHPTRPVLHLIKRIVGPLGLRVDESSPWADARLPEGSRGTDQNSWSRILLSTDPSVEDGVTAVSQREVRRRCARTSC